MRMRNNDLRKADGAVTCALPPGRAPPRKSATRRNSGKSKARPACSDVGLAVTDQSPPVAMIVMHRC